MAQVRVMTWNVESLFLPGDNAGPDTQAAFDRKSASLAALIDQSTPDIRALQERSDHPRRSISSAAR